MHDLRSLCTHAAGETWRAVRTGLRWAMCWRSSMVRCAGFTGLAVGASSSLGILRVLLYTSLATDACRSSFECLEDSEENQGKCLFPVLVHVAHDGCLQHLLEAFHESVSCKVVDSCL
jgi:hypothetical protein